MTPERHRQPLLASLLGSAKAAWTTAAFVVAIALISTFTLAQVEVSAPATGRQVDARQQVGTSGGEGSLSAAEGSGAANAAAPGSLPSVAPSTSGLACALGRNGGATDVGVTGKEIRLATTVVKSGIGRSFLGDAEFAMLAVIKAVNSTGGICGRQLTLKRVDDGWDPSAGQQNIKRFIQEGFFALAVVPSSEGLRAAGTAGDIDRAGIPVIGSDGMLIHQYTDPWIWPVAASTISTMHIIAKNAFDRGARSFGIVYDHKYHFGVEGAHAYREAVKRLGGTVKADVGIQPGQTDYKNDINKFNGSCGDPARPATSDCDFVATLLEPETGVTWVSGGAYLGTGGKGLGAGGPQTLFNAAFAKGFSKNCTDHPRCSKPFWVWTGFRPPVPPFDSDRAVSSFVGALKLQNSSADPSNQFVEGAYDGMLLLVQALKTVGPDLTRSRLRQALDGMDFDSGLATVRSFRVGNHFANTKMHAFSIVTANGDFAGWRYERTGWVADPWVGLDIPSE